MALRHALVMTMTVGAAVTAGVVTVRHLATRPTMSLSAPDGEADLVAAVHQVEPPSRTELERAFRAAGLNARDIFRQRLRISAERGRWVAGRADTLLLTLQVIEATPIDEDDSAAAEPPARAMLEDYVAVLDPETNRLLGRVFHLRTGTVHRKILAAADQLCLLYVAARDFPAGRRQDDSVLLRFAESDLALTHPLGRPGVTDASFTAEAASGHFAVHSRRQSGPARLLRRLRWDPPTATFVPLAR